MRVDNVHVVVGCVSVKNSFFYGFADRVILLSRDLIMTMPEKNEKRWSRRKWYTHC
jgi:hypothetical protein